MNNDKVLKNLYFYITNPIEYIKGSDPIVIKSETKLDNSDWIYIDRITLMLPTRESLGEQLIDCIDDRISDIESHSKNKTQELKYNKQCIVSAMAICSKTFCK